MTDETNSDRENQEAEDTGYEGMLSDFPNVLEDDKEETSEAPVDYNGMALSGILGEDVTVDAQEKQPPETVQEEDYSDFLKDLGDFDSDDSLVPEIEVPDINSVDTVSDDISPINSEAMEIPDGIMDSDMVVPDDNDELNAVTVAPVPEPPPSDSGDAEPVVSEVEEEVIAIDDTLFDNEPGPETIEASEEAEPDVIALEDILGEPDEIAVEQPQVVQGSDETTGSFEPIAVDTNSAEDEPEDTANGFVGLEMIADEDDTAAEPVTEDSFSGTEMVIDDTDTLPGDGYASLLDELGDDSAPQEAEESGEMDFLELDDEDSLEDADGDELSFIGMDSDETEDSAEGEVSAPAEDETEEDSDFLEFDLDIDDEDTGAESTEEEQAVVVPSADTDEDDDFLGLSDDAGGGEKKSDDFDVDTGTFSEVLFEGIDMDFDDQALVVTRAELLLAQNKRDEALALYKQLADTGATHWVTKRIEELS